MVALAGSSVEVGVRDKGARIGGRIGVGSRRLRWHGSVGDTS